MKKQKYCDLCANKGRKIIAIGEVMLAPTIGGGWANVCHSHYGLRANNVSVKLFPVVK